MKNWGMWIFAWIFSSCASSNLSHSQLDRIPAQQDVHQKKLQVSNHKWRFVIIPDTQIYTKNDDNLNVLAESVNWIIANKQKYNIEAVFHVGDIVDNNTPEQWQRAAQVLSKLRGKVRFYITTGNHDFGIDGLGKTRDTLFQNYFPMKSLSSIDGLQNVFSKSEGLLNATYDFQVGAESFRVLTLEFGPRDEVLNWALNESNAADEKKMILVIHEYMDMVSAFKSKDGRPTPSHKNTYGNAHHYVLSDTSKNNGQEIWQKLIFPSPNFEWVFSGHYDDVVSLTRFRRKPVLRQGHAFTYRGDTQSNGNIVHQTMFDAQWIDNGGDGWLQFVEFDSRRKGAARIFTYSPWLSEMGNLAKGEAQEPIDFEIRRKE